MASRLRGPREIAGKLRRLGRTLRLYAHPGEVRARLEALCAELGLDTPEDPLA